MADKVHQILDQSTTTVAPIRLVDLGDGSFAVRVSLGSGGAAITIQPTRGALTNRSGSITTGGTSQQLAPANANRNYLFIQNVSSSDLWFNFGTAAVTDQPSIRLLPAQSFTMEGSFVSTDAVNIISATTGDKFVAKEG